MRLLLNHLQANEAAAATVAATNDPSNATHGVAANSTASASNDSSAEVAAARGRFWNQAGWLSVRGVAKSLETSPRHLASPPLRIHEFWWFPWRQVDGTVRCKENTTEVHEGAG